MRWRAEAVPAAPAGGRLRVVAPAGAVRASVVEAGAARLRARGFVVEIDPQVFEVDPAAPFLAGTDARRAAALEAALREDGVDAVLCARGGYGAMRTLSLVDWARVRPRPLVGFSDITALHGALAARAGLASLHGPLLSTFPLHVSAADPQGERALDALVAALTGAQDEVRVEGLVALRDGEAEGPLLGGNLSLIASLAQTPWFPPLEGAILFLEEVGESAYRVDRMLSALSLRGALEGVAGVVLGDTGGAGDQYLPGEALEAFVGRRLVELLPAHVPVARGGPFGHRARNLTLPFGTRARLRCQGAASALVAEPAVRRAIL